jgi:3-deoxy-D-manno-octulosonate 8-phosphate phosphatase (KDO 8-P phosphatase)
MTANLPTPEAPADIMQRASQIRLVIFDVDGVFTDGTITLDSKGQESKSFNVRDGHGIRLLIHYGLQVAVLSGRSSLAVEKRMRELGIDEVLQGHQHKASAYLELSEKLGIKPENTAYVGDDIVDVQVMHQVGLAIAVADAHPWVKQNAHWLTQSRGGCGAVRECCELILHAQGLLEQALEYTLQC